MKRVCPTCRTVVPAGEWERHRQAHRNAEKPSATERGYGAEHRKLRKLFEPEVQAGGVLCARCGLPIVPGEEWDLGHVDGTRRTRYSGPEHRGSCNRATSSHGPSRPPRQGP